MYQATLHRAHEAMQHRSGQASGPLAYLGDERDHAVLGELPPWKQPKTIDAE